MKFFEVKLCKNILLKVTDFPHDGGPYSEDEVPFNDLQPNVTEAATEKHLPVVTVDGDRIHAEVGEVEHPMTPEHYIAFIMLRTEKGFQIVMLTPEDKPVADFIVNPDDKAVAVYEFCNLHGLWMTEL